jgi:hypothetical protein
MTTIKSKNQKISQKLFRFSFRKRKVQIVLDKVLIFRMMHRLHGRFWGVAAMTIMSAAFGICFLIRPDWAREDAALSYFGTDVRTAPYFAGAMFFGAYGLWRWRNYLMRTLRRKRPVSSFIFITILGLYVVALTPMAWQPVYKVHVFGMLLTGIGVASTVVADSLLTKITATSNITFWRSARFMSFLMIIIGGVIIVGSLQFVAAFNLMMIGELMLLAGYAIWITIKTYMGEGKRSQLSRILKSVVLVD